MLLIVFFCNLYQNAFTVALNKVRDVFTYVWSSLHTGISENVCLITTTIGCRVNENGLIYVITLTEYSNWMSAQDVAVLFNILLAMWNSSPPGQNGRHFEDDIFKCIFVKILYFD